jgi:hypothetical protein
MPPLDHLGFQHRDVRIMTDTTPGDLPTKANIVSYPCEISYLPSQFVKLAAMSALVDDAQPGDSFFFYCA